MWGGPGTGDGQFYGAGGVAVDAMENVYVTDGNGRVQKFTSDGVFLSKWGSLGTGDGQFVRVSDHREHRDRSIVNSNLGSS
jgi:tripartite motif-containing protein 71